ncbi:hypothetical protein [Metapseudomonas boanensis]|uniref:Uncharacterized protein n=1 Tax=Metapseudomonas boanensis TaxID=2822138 RepID=A0ABS5XAT1_9GAMM|nr:hypothetical protein [Pseudomonas boanensis]MBT8764794.1 hypothetical protein [Pseudomonas boanensis]
MSKLARIAGQHGNRMVVAGCALNTIADLLGCDGVEHHLSAQQVNGLHHAVKALAGLIQIAGFELCEHAEQEGKH